MNKEYLLDDKDVIKQLGSNENGLEKYELDKRKIRYGKNELKKAEKESSLIKFIRELSNLMTIVLIIAAVVSAFISMYSGETIYESLIILAVVLINAILGVYQQSKAEAAIESLQKMTAATCKVLRNGELETIKAEDLVPGDIILVEAGDAIPADARLIECASLKVEEAALTGEPIAVAKQIDKLEKSAHDIPLGDRRNMIFMGSMVSYGRGKAVVCRTGMDTEMGHIANAINTAKSENTPLQISLNQLSKILSFLVLGICAIVFVVDIGRIIVSGTGLQFQSCIDTFMVAVSLAVAAIPEGLSAVVTILLSIGVTKMSEKHAIIRKLTAVETLGCTQIICSDKTGTLTQNKMTVVEHYTDNEELLVTAMALCSDAELNGDEAVGEATECALVNDALQLGFRKSKLKDDYKRIGEVPFDSMRKMMTTVHINPNGGYVQFTKGAPDEVINHCTQAYIGGQVVKLTNSMKNEILDANKQMANKALRVLCAAYKDLETLPQSYDNKSIETDLIYIGLCGMMDPIRNEVKDAIKLCKEAGIRPIMITGDHKDTAVAIATELGILQPGQSAVTGIELNQMTDEELEERIQEISVYARVQPEHKVRIVKGWKKRGKVTAMTGDGANDAPSIKEADIGIGMGITGTDVTKNVADMVLADDNFATIICAVAEGRKIYDNIQKAVQFLLSSNLSEVIAIFISSLMGFTILKPAHLLWINLITDCFPAIGLGMEKEEDNIMKRRPRKKEDGILSDGIGFEVVIQGLSIALLTLAAYFIGHFIESGKIEITNSPDGMTMAFLTLSLLEVFHAFNMRSRTQSIFKLHNANGFLIMSLLMSILCTTAVIYIPFLRNIFSFERISIKEYLIAITIAVLIIPINEILKFIKRRKSGK